MYSLKLDGGRGTANTGLLPVHDGGHPADDFGRLGVALKAKVSKTELKVGEWMPVLPILRSDDGRSLPQTFRGGQVTSTEINGLSRSEEHTSELQSLMRISYAVFCLKKKISNNNNKHPLYHDSYTTSHLFTSDELTA